MKQGFTIIEMVIVVLIVSILAMLSLVYFNKYRQRAYAKDLVVLARGCAAEVVSECISRGGNICHLEVFSSSYSCGNRTLEQLGDVEMKVVGCCTKFVVSAVGSRIKLYKGECYGDYKNKLECDVVKR